MKRLMVVAALALIPEFLLAAMPQIVPFDEIKPGMTGHGLTVLRGTTPERFEFSVDSTIRNFQGYSRIIMVGIIGEPFVSTKDGLLSGTGSLGGMSGSPCYLSDGRLMGALMMSNGGQRNAAFAYLVPVEDMLAMRALAPKPSGSLEKPIAPGTSVAACTVWGELQACGTATASFDDGEFLYITGHEFESFKIGPVRVPLFESPIAGIVATFDKGSSKIAGTLGNRVGTLVYNGWWGGLVTGQQDDGIPVTVTVRGMSKQPFQRSARIAHFPKAAEHLGITVREYLHTIGVRGDESSLAACITVNAHTSIVIQGKAGDTFSEMIDVLEEALSKGIEAVAITLTRNE